MRQLAILVSLILLAGCNRPSSTAIGQSKSGGNPPQRVYKGDPGWQPEQPRFFSAPTFSPSGRYLLLEYGFYDSAFGVVVDVLSGKELGCLLISDKWIGPSRGLILDGGQVVGRPRLGTNLMALRQLGPPESLNDFVDSEPLSIGCRVMALDTSPDGASIAAVDNSGTIKSWDIATYRRKFAFRTDQGDERNPYIYGVRFLPDGKSLLTHSLREWKLWDFDAGKEIRTVEGTRSDLLAVTPDSKCALWIQTVEIPINGPFPLILKDLATDQEKQRFENPGWRTVNAVFSNDGGTLYSAQEGLWFGICCCDTATGKQRWKRQVHESPGTTSFIRISPDLQHVVSLNQKDGPVINIWELASGKLIHAIKITKPKG